MRSELSNFEQLANDKHIKVSSQWDGNWHFGLVPNYGSMTGSYFRTVFYDNGWREKIKTVSELKYLEFEFEIERWDLSHFYRYRREIEFLQKIHSGLALRVMYLQDVDMRTINQKWLRENKKFFKNSDRDFFSFELESRIKARGGKVVPGIEKYLDYRDINKIPKGVGIIRFQNWVIKNEVCFKYYLDYLGLLKDLKIKPDSENLIIPKDLRKAHDNAVELLNQLKREEIAKEFERALKLRKDLEMKVRGYSFIIPKTPQELIAEGKTLHHCVGGSRYVDGHSKGKTTIIFIRKNPYESLYTMEFKKERIIQIRGKHNNSAPNTVQEIADMWLKLVTKKPKSKAS